VSSASKNRPRGDSRVRGYHSRDEVCPGVVWVVSCGWCVVSILLAGRAATSLALIGDSGNIAGAAT
jgi:hypothetical protein